MRKFKSGMILVFAFKGDLHLFHSKDPFQSWVECHSLGQSAHDLLVQCASVGSELLVQISIREL
eukprot:3751905-Rhodomonas_salina.1